MILTPYTDVEAADRAAGAPATASLAMALRDGAEHDRLITYDPERHAPADGEAHRHRGDDSEHVAKVVPNTPNLISRCYAGWKKNWRTHGVEPGPAGYAFAAGGQWAASVLGDHTRPSLSLGYFGGGAHVVVSGYLRADRELEAGVMQMGLCNGGADKEDEKEFLAGTRVDIPFALIAEDWRRFWCVINTEGIEFSTSIRFALQCSESLMPVGGTVFANLFDVRPGRVLDYPVPGYVCTGTHYGQTEFSDGHADWGAFGYAPTGGPPPPFDHAMAITNAIQLAPR